MISIIIPVYNGEKTIFRCLDSILAQTLRDYEIIIINDGSTDNTANILSGWLNDRKEEIESRKLNIKIIQQENKGSNPARNRGAKEAKGEFLLFCDADIIAQPTMVAEMMEALKNNPDKAYAYSSFQFGFKKFPSFYFDGEKLKKFNYIHATSLIRRESFPGWDENIKRLQDWDLMLTVLKKGQSGVYIPKFLFKVIAGGTMSSWLPSFVYKILPFLPAVKKYKMAEKVIKEKHNLS